MTSSLDMYTQTHIEPQINTMTLHLRFQKYETVLGFVLLSVIQVVIATSIHQAYKWVGLNATYTYSLCTFS